MKKIITLLCTSLIVLLMFVGPGNVAFAHEEEEHDCGCIVEPIYGAEKNKIVSNLLKSEEFKNVKKDNMRNGLNLKGVKGIEVIYNITHEVMMVGVPFVKADGTVIMEAFFNGVYMDPTLIVPSNNEQVE
jgi:hypothetical protein